MSADKFEQERQSPRAEAALEVEVEVAGEKRKALLTTKDIGAGGMFLRTDNPSPLWKKVKLAFDLADGSRFEVGGEVVRSLSPDKAREKGGQPGMAVAFDELSRSKRKQLVELVLDLCSRRPAEKQAAPAPKPARPEPKITPSAPPPTPTARRKASDDELLRELDSLIESVEDVKAPTRAVKDADISLELNLPEEEEEEPLSPDKVAHLQQNLQQYLGQVKGNTHYQVLLLGAEVGAEQIQQAYRFLLEKLSPDIPAERLPPQLRQELSDALIRIRKAYAILSQPDRKRAYDFLIDNTSAKN